MNFLDYLQKEYSKDVYEKLINEFDKERTYSFILNTIKYDETFVSDIIYKKHPYIDNAYYSKQSLGNDYRFYNGVFYIQDAASMMISKFLDVNENDIILDMCAAPGGKSIDIAIKLKNNGILISNDINYSRAKILSNNIENYGFSNVFVTCNDFEKIYKFYNKKFSKIILDAPCSGSFMFRKNEFAKEDWTQEKVKKYSLMQENLLEYAYYMLQDGGTLYYSTCSLSKQENENQIEKFLNKHEDLELIDLNKDNEFVNGDKNIGIYIMPYLFECEGQYICLIKKHCKTSIFFNNINFSNVKMKELNFLNFKNLYKTDNGIYGFNNVINLKYFNVLRYGLKILDIENKKITPSLALSRYLDNDNTIKLTYDEFKQYISGQQLNINKENGYYIVSYNNINLGFIKVSNNKGNNLYPKKLRSFL